MKIILASSSPRRRELLAGIGLDFDVLPADIDESVAQGMPPQKAVQSLALGKARKVAEINPAALVIGSDTVVSIDGVTLGKPVGRGGAKAMLSTLSGRVHTVFSGVAVIFGGREDVFFESTQVEFYPLSDEKIERYIDTGEPFDKAGGYGIQGIGSLLVRRIDGDYFNVMGLPVASLARHLEAQFGLNIL